MQQGIYRRVFGVAVAFAVMGVSSSARAATIFSDGFEDNDRTDGVDPTDIPWYIAAQNQTVGVVADPFAGGGSTYALDVNIGDNDSLKRIVGQFPSTTLAIGNSMTLTVAFRATSAVINTVNTDGFRFGLYNSGDTTVSADTGSTSGASEETNDIGYNVRIPTGNAPAVSAARILKEPSGDNTLGGNTGGTAITTAGGPNVVLADQSLHRFDFTISRTAASALSLSFSLDNAVVATAVDAAALTSTFDHVYFGSGFFNNLDYQLDNVSLETVPEPTAAGLLAGVALGLLARRRRTAAHR